MTEQQPITVKGRVLGIFYKGDDQPLVFSIEDDQRNIMYGHIPGKETECRQMAHDAGVPLEQWVLDWNDREIQREQERIEKLADQGLGFVLTGTTTGSFKDFMIGDLSKDVHVDK